MKVLNMQSASGNKVTNQFFITEHGRGALGNFTERRTFQSYDSVIATVTYWPNSLPETRLDSHYWDYSRTTDKYRNQFLGESKAETQKKIDSGEYILTNLNK